MTQTPPARGMPGRLHHPGDQKVTFVELFFDLVFVFAITQVTKYVVEDLTWAGGAEALLLLWMIWWAWTQFTWALNPADTTQAGTRLPTLVATAVGFLLAISVPTAYGDAGLLFAIAYVIVRVLGIGISAASAADERHRAAIRVFATWSGIPTALVLVGGFVDTPARAWVWLAAAILEVVAVARAGTAEGWGVRPGHFAERHGLIVIIALGESLIVAGQSVLSKDSSALLLTVAMGAVTLTCLLWWLYFGWWQEAMEERLDALSPDDRTTFARDAYSLLHFFVIAGIIAIAVGIEEMVLHPDEPLPTVVKVVLALGIVLFLGATDLGWWRATRRLLPSRTTIGVGLAALVSVLDLAALSEIIMVATGLAAIAAWEAVRPPAASLAEAG